MTRKQREKYTNRKIYGESYNNVKKYTRRRENESAIRHKNHSLIHKIIEGKNSGKKRFFSSKFKIYMILIYILFENLYTWVTSQNVKTITPVTDWLREWQTKNTSNVNIISI